MIKTAIVILNWNTRHYLEKFLPFLVKYTSLPDVQLVLADNGSTDDSVEFVRKYYPAVTTIVFDKNYGFAEGYNIALKQVNAEYYIILNSDIEVTENWLPPLLTILEQNDKIAACMPKIRSYLNPGYFEYAGAAGGFLDKFGYPFCKGRIFTTLEKDDGQYDGTYQIQWATGACLAIKAELFHKFEGFDPYFFAHQEEVDLCWRLINAGYEIYCTSNSLIYHIGGGTLPKSNPHKTYLNFRNTLVLLYKNTHTLRFIYIFLIKLILDAIAVLKVLCEKKPKDALAIIMAHLSFYKYFFYHKKPDITNYFSQELIFNKSIVFQYFILKKMKFSQLSFNKYKSKNLQIRTVESLCE
jgi:GT2 family glycosyltransferase